MQVAALKKMATEGGPTYNLSQQPWAQPGKTCVRESREGQKSIPPNLCSKRQRAESVFLQAAASFFFSSLFSKDQRHSDGHLPGDEEQAAKHFTEHVLVLGQ